MAKPIISIDVDDSAFQRFLELFKVYSEKVEEMPEAWQALNSAMGDAGKSLEGGAVSGKEALALAAAQATLIVEELHLAVQAQNELGRSTHTSNKGMTTLGKTVKGLGRDIFGIATSVLKMGSVGLGLGAIGSGFGLEALASSALNRQRSSNSLGLTPGQLSSFQVNAQPFLGMRDLQAAAAAQIDIQKAGSLSVLGIDYGKANKRPATDVAFDALRAATKAYLANPENPMATPQMQAFKALGFNEDDVRYAAMQKHPFDAINAAQRATRNEAGALGFDQQTGAQWITLKKALDSAGVTIETGLIKALAPLAPQIATLSKEFVGFIATFLNGPQFKVVIDDVKIGLSSMSDFLTKTDWKAVGGDIVLVSSEIGAVAEKLKWLIPGTQVDKSGHDHGFMGHTGQGDFQWLKSTTSTDRKKAAAWIDAHDKGPFGLIGNGVGWLGKTLGTNAEIGIRRLAGQYDPEMIHQLNIVASNKHKVPLAIMDRLAMDESGYGKNLVSGAGALGPYQFMPDTAKDYGINPLDTRAASGAAGKMLSELYSKYHAWDKAIAAYNMGGGALDEDIKKHGSDWLKYAPKETQGEVANVVGANAGSMDSAIARALAKHAKAITRSTGKPTKVSITNSTAARVAVSVNAAAIA